MADKKVINIKYKPFQWQLDLHKGLDCRWSGCFHIVKSIRQVGKSTMIQMILLKAALKNEYYNCFAVSPTNAQAHKLFVDLATRLGKCPIVKKTNETRNEIVFTNGSVIRCFSAEMGDNLRGYTANLVCIDECAYIDDYVFYSCVLGWTLVNRAPVVMCSTPRLKSGFFYDYFCKGLVYEKDKKVWSYDWTTYDTSEILTDEVKESFRQSMPRLNYMCEFEGQFMSLEGSVFGAFDKVVMKSKGGKKIPYDSSKNYYIGVDWGSGNGGDDTAIAVVDSDRRLVDLRYFNDKDETETINAIIDTISDWRAIKIQVEMNSIGSVFYQLLNKAVREKFRDVQVIGFTTTNESKARLVNRLQVDIQNGTIELLNDPKLLLELSAYEAKPSKTGKMTYNASSGNNDDLIIATMLAFDCGSNVGTPSVFFI